MKITPYLKKQNIFPLISSLILFASVPVVFAWTSPSAIPPSGNVSTPINVGSGYQIKQGKLGLFAPSAFLRISQVDSYIPTGALNDNLPSLLLGVNGKVGANEYCDERGNNCIDLSNLSANPGNNTNTQTQGSTTCSYREKTFTRTFDMDFSRVDNSGGKKEITIPAGQWKITGNGHIGLGTMGGGNLPYVSMTLSKNGVFNAKTNKVIFKNNSNCTGQTRCTPVYWGPWELKDEAKNVFTFEKPEKLQLSADQTRFTGVLIFTSPVQEYVCVTQ